VNPIIWVKEGKPPTTMDCHFWITQITWGIYPQYYEDQRPNTKRVRTSLIFDPFHCKTSAPPVWKSIRFISKEYYYNDAKFKRGICLPRAKQNPTSTLRVSWTKIEVKLLSCFLSTYPSTPVHPLLLSLKITACHSHPFPKRYWHRFETILARKKTSSQQRRELNA
jgi:hypothetical protein